MASIYKHYEELSAVGDFVKQLIDIEHSVSISFLIILIKQILVVPRFCF